MTKPNPRARRIVMYLNRSHLTKGVICPIELQHRLYVRRKDARREAQWFHCTIKVEIEIAEVRK